jgi:hypothetical protein
MTHKYLFIQSPPYSGSTMLWRLLQTSASVAALPDEGQKLPELRSMMRSDPWNPDAALDWAQIDAVWHSYWDLSKPVLLEKSPPHLCRAERIDSQFSPAWHILLLRDPLAICESLHRRNGLPYDEAAMRWLAWLDMHLRCRVSLERQHTLYYETLVDTPDSAFDELTAWMPELADVHRDAAVLAHSPEGYQSRPITDYNRQKLHNISEHDRQAALKVLRARPDVLGQTPYAGSYL